MTKRIADLTEQELCFYVAKALYPDADRVYLTEDGLCGVDLSYIDDDGEKMFTGTSVTLNWQTVGSIKQEHEISTAYRYGYGKDQVLAYMGCIFDSKRQPFAHDADEILAIARCYLASIHGESVDE